MIQKSLKDQPSKNYFKKSIKQTFKLINYDIIHSIYSKPNVDYTFL